MVETEFADEIRALGFGESGERLLRALAEREPTVAVRLNPAKQGCRPCRVVSGEGVRPVGWCAEGFYLPDRPRFTFDPAMHQGRYYVQEASSMIISHVVRHLTGTASEPVRYLDACAAPGGKTTAAIAALPEGSLAVANEFDYRRASILRENVAKWGSVHTVVSRGDTGRFSAFSGFFDIIAVDAPCSGEGMMRKDAQAVEQWSPRLVEECAARQCEILDNIWGALRPGGYMIYFTCTFNRRENEEMVARLVEEYGAEPVEVPVSAEWNILPSATEGIPAMRFFPGVAEGEGLFMAVVRKPGEGRNEAAATAPKKKKKGAGGAAAVAVPAEAKNWIREPENYRFEVDQQGIAFAIPKQWETEIEMLARGLDTLSRGVEIGTVKGRDLVPSQALAMSQALNREAFPKVELTEAEAIAYLRRETITIPHPTPRGLVLATYEGYPLGFLKHLGNRSNNLYPQHWRILTEK